MTLSDFLDQVVAGEIMVRGGARADGANWTTKVPLGTDNVEQVAFEAAFHGCFSVDTKWDDALVQVKAGLYLRRT